MQGHSIEAWTHSGLAGSRSGKGQQECFDGFVKNKFGQIMKSADENTFNCMKLAHYLPEYQRLFEKLDGSKVNFLEIGVQHGGSYRLWKNFFGEDLLRWTGIDINNKCLAFNDFLSPENGLVCCGSQADSEFLEKVSSQRGNFDIIVDDGSHQSEHIIASFKVLAKHVKDGGLYIIEDVHACYWKGFRGSSDSLNALAYFLELAHSLNSQAVQHDRCSKNLSSSERVVPPARIQKIELLPSMIICHMGTPHPIIEWKAGKRSILS